jgi:hypothetical protein
MSTTITDLAEPAVVVLMRRRGGGGDELDDLDLRDAAGDVTFAEGAGAAGIRPTV